MNTSPIVVVLLTGLAYFAGASLSVQQTVTEEGIAILWLPNAILLAAFLVQPARLWPWLALAALAAELLADASAFPVWASLLFGGINLFEVTLAAVLVRRLTASPFRFDRVRHGFIFLLCAPLLAAALAGLLGATVYVQLGRADTSYIALWRLWWFGDALALLVVTPLLVVLWHRLNTGWQWPRPARAAEALVLGLLITLMGLQAFRSGELQDVGFLITPVALLLLSVFAALRHGLTGATGAVALISALAVYQLVHGRHPYVEASPQYAVWLMQEYLATIAVVSVGLAILLREIADQRHSLQRQEAELREYNSRLETLVDQRTSALEQANARLTALAATDELTSMPNRRSFRQDAERELLRLHHADLPAALIMVDLDHFKEINDSHGHEAGDEILRNVLPPLREALRPRDLIGRIGGEEFAILLSGVDEPQALEVAERARKAIEAGQTRYREYTIPVTASFGVTASAHSFESLDELLRQADEAMYEAKWQGRNRVAVYGRFP